MTITAAAIQASRTELNELAVRVCLKIPTFTFLLFCFQHQVTDLQNFKTNIDHINSTKLYKNITEKVVHVVIGAV